MKKTHESTMEHGETSGCMEPVLMYIEYMQSPLGTIEIRASEIGLTHILFVEKVTSRENVSELTRDSKRQLVEYFQGKREQFDLRLDQSGSDFQKSVWLGLCHIPFGKTMSYGELAYFIDNPKAVRAVGAANGKNPISIVVPCHRVIGRDKTLTGYAGGLRRKAWLLKHEGIDFADPQHIQTDLFN